MLTGFHRTKWFLPLFSVTLGVGFQTALWVGGDPVQGLISLAIMAGLALFLLVAGGSETVSGLRGDGKDERFARIDLVATAIAGNVLIGMILALCGWEWAHGRDGNPYVPLGAITGVVYLVSVVVLRLRS
jgi:hypothetical protein